jgi:hypothetical protein
MFVCSNMFFFHNSAKDDSHGGGCFNRLVITVSITRPSFQPPKSDGNPVLCPYLIID